jgi:hypothetical protein
MPRKSPDAILTPPPVRSAPKLEIPYALSDAEGAIWRAVTDAMPADYFSSAQVGQLQSYCEAMVIKASIKAELDREMAKKKPREKVIEKKRAELNKWITTANQLARSMRLTHQAVYDHQTAFSRHKSGKATQGASALQLLNAGRALDAVDAAE